MPSTLHQRVHGSPQVGAGRGADRERHAGPTGRRSKGERWGGGGEEVKEGEEEAGAAPSVPPGPTDLIVSGVLLININNSVTEGIWENLIKRTPCKLAALPRNHSSETQGSGEKSMLSPRGL